MRASPEREYDKSSRNDLGAHEGGSCGHQEAGREAWRPSWRSLDAKARAAGRATLQQRGHSGAVNLAPTIKELQATGCELLRGIATVLRGVAFPRPATANGLLCRSLGCWRRPPSLSRPQASPAACKASPQKERAGLAETEDSDFRWT